MAEDLPSPVSITDAPSNDNNNNNNPGASLCVNDLLHPTERAESLLESLTTEQLNVLEQTLHKVREKKTSTSTPPKEEEQEDWSLAASQVAKALADAISSSIAEESSSKAVVSSHEPITEVRDGVEWVSFVYSHHRILRRYCIRTDLEKVDINQLDEKFKRDNCVYPRANLPRETYRGNRWAYETECNMLGWKLAYLNESEIAGKRGLIQRAVDSYRNRYPSMRSRRVARQEKLLNGTLRKRKHREDEGEDCGGGAANKQLKSSSSSTCERYLPKTISIDDGPNGTKCRVRINIETVPLEVIDMPFRKNNCVFPRAMNITPDTPSVTERQLDEAKCNELGWKLAWLNPRQLANRKCLLQRVLDIYRVKFAPHLRPRKYASRMPPAPFAPPPTTSCSTNNEKEPALRLTAEALAAVQQQQQLQQLDIQNDNKDDQESIYSGTTASLDFRDCFSPPADSASSPFMGNQSLSDEPTTTNNHHLIPGLSSSRSSSTTAYSLDQFMLPASRGGDPMLCSQQDPFAASLQDDMSCHLSVESGGSSISHPSNQSSPRHVPLIGLSSLDDFNPDSSSGFLTEQDMTLFGASNTTDMDLLKRYLSPHDENDLGVHVKMEPQDSAFPDLPSFF